MAVDNPVRTDAEKKLRNEDPLSGEAGAHPVGTGVGAALGGAATGAVVGTVAGPLGTVVGAVVGSIAGGLAGKAVAEGYDPTVEVEYWRGESSKRPYYNKNRKFADYEPAYRAGANSYDPTAPADFADREMVAREEWERQGQSLLTWHEARPAAADAYARLQQRRG